MSEELKNGEPSTQNIEKYRVDILLSFLVIQEFAEKFDIWVYNLSDLRCKDDT